MHPLSAALSAALLLKSTASAAPADAFNTTATASAPSHARPSVVVPDPAFPFTDLCTSWRLEYLVRGGELALWTSCRNQQTGAAVISLLPLDHSLVASAEEIKPAFPSNAAPRLFSSVCQGCALTDPNGSVVACRCTSNGGAPPLAVDLAEWITTSAGVTCFTDGRTCGAVQRTVPLASHSTEPTCTEK